MESMQAGTTSDPAILSGSGDPKIRDLIPTVSSEEPNILQKPWMTGSAH